MAKRKLAEVQQHLEQLTIEWVPISGLHANDYNPNRQKDRDFQLLKQSITEDGFTQPIVVAEDYTIIDGEHRWRAAADLGLPQVPVVRLDLDAARARIATLRHNRARGSEDVELANAVIRDLQELGALEWATKSLMLTAQEVDDAFADLRAPSALAGDEFTEAWEPDKEGVSVEETKVMDQTESAAQVPQRERYRVTAQFYGPDAVLVQQTLGEHPAEKLLQLCQEVERV